MNWNTAYAVCADALRTTLAITRHTGAAGGQTKHIRCAHTVRKRKGNPGTVHCYNSTNGNLERDYGDIPDIVLCFVAQKCKKDAYVTLGSGLRDELELDSMDITEVLIESEKHYGIKAEGQSRDMDTVMDIVDWIWENKK